MSKSNYLENKLLDHQFGTAWTPPANLYISLFTAMPSDDSAGTEVSGTGYARQAVANNGSTFAPTPATAGSKHNAVQFDYNVGGVWGTIVGFGIHDAASGGNLLRYGALSAPKTPTTGDVLSFEVGDLVCTEE